MPIQVILGPALYVRGLAPRDLERLRKRLTFAPRVRPGTPSHVPRPKPLCLVSDGPEGFVALPRSLGLLGEWRDDNIVIHDQQEPVQASSRTRVILPLDPRRCQDQAVRECEAALRSSPFGGGGVLSLPTGWGKTLCALTVGCRIQAKRILILVHTRVLADQWMDRVRTLVEGSVPVFLEPGTPFDGDQECTHVVALMQTILARARNQQQGMTTLGHDMVIVDETHHLCARTLSQTLDIVGARYRLGLSATPERQDGLHTMLEHLLGPMVFRCERTDPPPVHVRVLSSAWNDLPCNPFSPAVTALAADPSRQTLLATAIGMLHREGRHIVVMSDRIDQLRDLETRLAPLPTVYAIGGSRGSPDLENRPIVLATFAYSAEGLDLPLLNTCVLATPRLDVKQCVGRVLRQPDQPALIVDVDDPAFHRQFLVRRRFYTRDATKGGLSATVSSFQFQPNPKLANSADTNEPATVSQTMST